MGSVFGIIICIIVVFGIIGGMFGSKIGEKQKSKRENENDEIQSLIKRFLIAKKKKTFINDIITEKEYEKEVKEISEYERRESAFLFRSSLQSISNNKFALEEEIHISRGWDNISIDEKREGVEAFEKKLTLMLEEKVIKGNYQNKLLKKFSSRESIIDYYHNNNSINSQQLSECKDNFNRLKSSLSYDKKLISTINNFIDDFEFLISHSWSECLLLFDETFKQMESEELTKEEINNISKSKIEISNIAKEDIIFVTLFHRPRLLYIKNGKIYIQDFQLLEEENLKKKCEILEVEDFVSRYFNQMWVGNYEHYNPDLENKRINHKKELNSDISEYIMNAERRIYSHDITLMDFENSGINFNSEKEYHTDMLNFIFHIEIYDRIKNYSHKKTVSYFEEYDKDNNGIIDLSESQDFSKLLDKYESKIIEIDPSHIHKFVKVSNYMKKKAMNIQEMFESIKKSKNLSEINEEKALLNNQIHSYEIILFHSINMVGALINNKMTTFYEIYETLDKINIFNSNWENEVSEKLHSIENGISDLNNTLIQVMVSIWEMESKIVKELKTLTYFTREGFSELNSSITSELQSIDSSIKFNNLLTGIQTYQMYKVNKNTKSLRE